MVAIIYGPAAFSLTVGRAWDAEKWKKQVGELNKKKPEIKWGLYLGSFPWGLKH